MKKLVREIIYEDEDGDADTDIRYIHDGMLHSIISLIEFDLHLRACKGKY